MRALQMELSQAHSIHYSMMEYGDIIAAPDP